MKPILKLCLAGRLGTFGPVNSFSQKSSALDHSATALYLRFNEDDDEGENNKSNFQLAPVSKQSLNYFLDNENQDRSTQVSL